MYFKDRKQFFVIPLFTILDRVKLPDDDNKFNVEESGVPESGESRGIAETPEEFSSVASR